MNLFLQSLIVGLITWYVATAMPMFLRWSFYFGAPLVGGLVNGLLFGNLALGLQTGAVIQMAYLGTIAVGGSLPSDLAIAGYLGTALAVSANLEPEAALTVAIALGALGLLCFNVKMTMNAIWVQRADKYAAAGDIKGIRNMNLFASQIFPFITYAIPSFLAVYFGSQLLESIMSVIPPVIISGLKITGGLIPALGISMLLSYVWKIKYVPYFVIGFILVSYLKLDITFIAILGICVAAIYVLGNKDKDGKEGAING
ncbi:MAG: PTS sugar transporter subunit IIC [Lachnospiraceae bacterium]|nr:PTS sugar transporter subunit IIC [Lachnospiraceae bacterium]